MLTTVASMKRVDMNTVFAGYVEMVIGVQKFAHLVMTNLAHILQKQRRNQCLNN